MTKQFTKQDIGCIFDGAYGDEFNGQRTMELAQAYGWDGKILLANDENFYEAVEEATQFLNGADLCEEGIYFVWDSGDLLLVYEG
jgi:hypothetical protein